MELVYCAYTNLQRAVEKHRGTSGLVLQYTWLHVISHTWLHDIECIYVIHGDMSYHTHDYMSHDIESIYAIHDTYTVYVITWTDIYPMRTGARHARIWLPWHPYRFPPQMQRVRDNFYVWGKLVYTYPLNITYALYMRDGYQLAGALSSRRCSIKWQVHTHEASRHTWSTPTHKHTHTHVYTHAHTHTHTHIHIHTHTHTHTHRW